MTKITAGPMECDNELCDWVDDKPADIEKMKELINKPCPVCGENLFTFKDYELTVDMLSIAEALSQMSNDSALAEGEKISGYSMKCTRDGHLTITEKTTAKAKTPEQQ